MNATEEYPLVIIGSGPAGLTAGIYASRSNLRPLIVEGTQPGGQLMGTSFVENWPGDKRVLGGELMMRMKEQAKELGCKFLADEVIDIEVTAQPFTIFTRSKKILKAHAVIIATGATSKRLGCPGENEYWGKGVSTCAVCDGAFYKDVPVVVIGGGDTAMEEASFMSKFTKDITIVHILDKLTASAAMQQRVLSVPTTKILYKKSVISIEGNGTHVTGLHIKDLTTGEITQLPARAIFLGIGLQPNTAPFKNKIELDNYGYLQLTNQTHTSIPGIFGAGDVADYRYRQAITSAGAGCMAALDAERYLSLNKL